MRAFDTGGIILTVALFLSSNSVVAANVVGDAAQGKIVFARCAICHGIDPGKNKLGPSLANIVGQKAGHVQGFGFSPAMKASKLIWTPDNLDKFLTNPRAFMPGNKMPFAGLPSPTDRANVIAYLAEPRK